MGVEKYPMHQHKATPYQSIREIDHTNKANGSDGNIKPKAARKPQTAQINTDNQYTCNGALILETSSS
jgi:hypothetical protein